MAQRDRSPHRRTHSGDRGGFLHGWAGSGGQGLSALLKDVRYAVRTHRRAPRLALVVILTLTFAIGSTAAVFSLLNALAFRKLPVRDPSSLVQVSTLRPVEGDSPLTFSMFRELGVRQQVFSSVIGEWGTTVVTLRDGGVIMKGLLWAATGNVYKELGLRPTVGRLLAPNDMTIDPTDARPVAVLGYSFYQRHYHGDVSVIGRTIQVDGRPFVVIGVAPSTFTGFALVTEPDVTIPLAATPLLSGKTPSTLDASQSRSVRIVGRLKTGVTMDQARASLMAVWPSAREAALPPGSTGARRVDFLSTGLVVSSAATGIETSLRRQYVQPLVILFGLAILVLLIACTNIASLLLSSTNARRHEIGVRLALGASRWRVATQVLVEGVLLSVAGAACGAALAFWACSRLTRIVFEEYSVSVVFDGRPDAVVLGFTAGIGVLAGILCAAVPAWRAARGTAGESLTGEGRTFSSGRIGRVMVCTQLALSFVLLTMAGLLVRSLSELHAVKTGIDRGDDVLIAYPEAAYQSAYDGVDNDVYYPQVLRKLEALPGITRASASLLKPGIGGGFRDAVSRIGDLQAATGILATRSPVAPGFFSAVGIPLIEGRDFEWHDNSRSRRVTVLSQSLARRIFGEVDPVGQHVRVGFDPDGFEVVGVAADARLYDLKSSDVAAAYTAALQDADASDKCLVIRGVDVSVAAVVRAVEALGRERIDDPIVTLRYITDRSLLLERLAAMMSKAFGFLVLLLAGVGLFGLMSYSVAQRRREIGIRIALGATASQVVTSVVLDGLVVALTGLSVGIVAALLTVRVVKTLLFGVRPQDPLTLSAAGVFLVAVAIVACLTPASRAAHVDPTIVLRDQ
jgi:putative ABC transport system permease protein